MCKTIVLEQGEKFRNRSQFSYAQFIIFHAYNVMDMAILKILLNVSGTDVSWFPVVAYNKFLGRYDLITHDDYF